MAIDTKKYINKVDVGIKADKNYQEFYLYLKIDSRKYRKILNYSSKHWDKRTKISQAKLEIQKIRDKSTQSELNENITLNQFSERIFNTYLDTKWNKTKKNYYQKYIENFLGKKQINKIVQLNIKELIKHLENKELSPRTVKTSLEVLSPIFNDAIANKLILNNPCANIVVKRPNTKKIVLNASEKLVEVHNAITSEFKDDPFYYCLFMFALQGRRKSEILNIKWEDIDFINDVYVLPKTKSGFEQKFYLPKDIKEKLPLIETDNIYVFNSRKIKDKPIQNVRDQVNKLKKVLWADFHMHYCRNIISSAMSEKGVEAIFQSGALGHNDPNTIKKYTSLDYVRGSKEASNIIDQSID